MTTVLLNRNTGNGNRAHRVHQKSPRDTRRIIAVVQDQHQEIGQATDHHKDQHWRDRDRSVISGRLESIRQSVAY